MWSPNELLKTEKQRDILSYITLQFFPFKKVPLEHYPKARGYVFASASAGVDGYVDPKPPQQSGSLNGSSFPIGL